MKLGKAPELVKKAAAVLKSKTGVLGARLLVLASLRRRMAATAAISHRIHALVAAAANREKASRVDCHRALVPRKTTMVAVGEKPPPAVVVHRETVDISRQLALFDQECGGDGSFHDWTHSLFDDDDCFYPDEYEDGDGDYDDGGVVLDGDEDEPSAMDVIRINREVEGLEFNMDDEIDQAADMFIRRFRERMHEPELLEAYVRTYYCRAEERV